MCGAISSKTSRSASDFLTNPNCPVSKYRNPPWMSFVLAEEVALAEKIKDLMALDKLYQEPAFSRADLARELDVSENVLSRVINCAFEKSFRKLLNDHRVDEAQLLLRDSDLQVTQIAFDVGFNAYFGMVSRVSPQAGER